MINRIVRDRLAAAGSCALLGSLLSFDALAADEPPEGRLDEVIVSARYRTESVQETPLAITALSADALEQHGIVNVQNLTGVVPNTFIAQGAAGAVGSPTISMRGVQQVDFMFSFEAPVGIYIDDVYRPHMLGSDLELLDIDHIEVLRGPQGTLFGNSSMGGAIRIFSKKAEGKDTGFLQALVGNQGQQSYRGSFDTTLVPGFLYMRASGAYKHIDGYVDLLDFPCQMNANGTPGLIPAGVTSHAFSNSSCITGNEGEDNIKAGRVMFRMVPNDDSEITLALDRTDNDRTVTPDVTFATINQATAVAQGYVPPTGVWDSRFLAPGRYNSYAWPNTPNESNMLEWGIASTASYNFTDNVRGKLIFGHRAYDATSSFNADASPLGLIQNWNPIHHTQDSYELQLTGEAFENKVEWTTGAYYFKGNTHLGGHIIFTTLSFDQDDNFDDKNQSAFVHAVFNATEKLSFTGGLRYSKSEKTFLYHHPGIGPPAPPAGNAFEDERPDWTIGANYKFADSFMGYASVATGYRPGGVNPRPIVVPDQLQTFAGEEMTSYEVGFKSQWLENRARANLAVFYSDYAKKLSAATGKECLGAPGTPQPYLPTATCPAGTFAEPPWFYYVTGPASVEGVEGEFAYEPIPRLRWDASFGYNHFKSKITDQSAPNYVDPANLPQPEWNANSGVQYGMALPAGVLTPRLEWTYVSKMTFNGTPSLPFDARFGATGQAAYDLTATPARSLFNARLGFESDDGKWGTAFTVTNLFNKFYWENKFDLSGLVVSGIPSRSRTWALSVSRNFQ